MARIAAVTGAGSGIGRAAARALLEAGWQVALLGRRAAMLEETAGDAPGALCLPCDVSQPDRVEAAFAAIEARWSRLDLLFNNAGGGLGSRLIDEVSWEDWRAVMGVNLDGMFLCARAAFALMRRQDPRGGRIVNNGSISAHAPRPGALAYTVSKHGVTGLTRQLSLDGRPFDIACGQIDIGNAATALASAMAAGVPQADGSIRPEPVMDVEIVARSLLYMAGLPLEANAQFLTVMATRMPFVGRG